MKTFADLFTGGGGASLGAIAAGLKPIWGIEKDPAIAEIGQLNINKTIYGITRKVDRENPLICDHIVAIREVEKLYPNWWEGKVKHNRVPDWLHASPPCVNASRANNGNETSEDMELAEAICRAIAILKPKYFSLENVAGYVNFQSFDLIFKTVAKQYRYLSKLILNCADFGIPQSRKRLFLVASNSDFHLFQKLHLKKQEPVGWYEAIADLIHTLEPTKLTASQSQALVNNHKVLNNLTETDTLFRQVPDLVIQRSGARKKDGIYANTVRLSDEPMFTVKSMSGNVRPSVQQATLIIDGKRLKPDIQCYARWQTFPDSYQWPVDFKLAMKICGNAVPPLMMKQIIEAVLGGTNHD